MFLYRRAFGLWVLDAEHGFVSIDFRSPFRGVNPLVSAIGEGVSRVVVRVFPVKDDLPCD
jgi:hypothetical protein